MKYLVTTKTKVQKIDINKSYLKGVFLDTLMYFNIIIDITL